jgi:hypothetical protein
MAVSGPDPRYLVATLNYAIVMAISGAQWYALGGMGIWAIVRGLVFGAFGFFVLRVLVRRDVPSGLATPKYRPWPEVVSLLLLCTLGPVLFLSKYAAWRYMAGSQALTAGVLFGVLFLAVPVLFGVGPFAPRGFRSRGFAVASILIALPFAAATTLDVVFIVIGGRHVLWGMPFFWQVVLGLSVGFLLLAWPVVSYTRQVSCRTESSWSGATIAFGTSTLLLGGFAGEHWGRTQAAAGLGLLIGAMAGMIPFGLVMRAVILSRLRQRGGKHG